LYSKDAKKSWKLILEQFPDSRIEHRYFAVQEFSNGYSFNFRLDKEYGGWANWFIEVEYKISDTHEIKVLDDEVQQSIKKGENTRFPSGNDRALLSAAGYEIGSSWLNHKDLRDSDFLKVKIREPLTIHRLEGQMQLSVLLGDAHFADRAYQARRYLEKTPKRPSGSKPSFWNFSDFGWFLVYHWHEKVWKTDTGKE
jgi:hypothetical protein